MLCKAYTGHFIYASFLIIIKKKKKKKKKGLVLCLDCPVSDYACTIYQAALLQKSEIILRTALVLNKRLKGIHSTAKG